VHEESKCRNETKALLLLTSWLWSRPKIVYLSCFGGGVFLVVVVVEKKKKSSGLFDFPWNPEVKNARIFSKRASRSKDKDASKNKTKRLNLCVSTILYF
jgi:hypothetical protein